MDFDPLLVLLDPLESGASLVLKELCLWNSLGVQDVDLLRVGDVEKDWDLNFWGALLLSDGETVNVGDVALLLKDGDFFIDGEALNVGDVALLLNGGDFLKEGACIIRDPAVDGATTSPVAADTGTVSNPPYSAAMLNCR
eukprot:CAMPEP_0182899102 /NCGR_PEP_ID=MMETSP0034_2-20130328/27874_1 /TAXON_ID=156128 /ORGANISM="Nephroselmis pyriformis, Strain CCMP717" /LENGTH=139 /DNA_ID=CAMNT_0025033103 /DNA_START=406 /DNA_END=825 /DNA_ORIENTATION=-